MKRYAIALIGIVQSVAVAQGPQGEWEQWFWFGNDLLGDDATVAIDLIHVPPNPPLPAKVLALTRPVPNFPTIPTSRLWTPPPVGSPPGYSGVFEEANVAADTFCGGHSALDDGRILHVGGRFVTDVDLFNPWEPVPNQWNIPLDPPDMTFKRFYPTATTLADGRVLVTSGLHCDHSENNMNDPTYCGPRPRDPWVRTPELYDPVFDNWEIMWSSTRQQVLYPYMFVLPDGRLVDAGPGPTSFLDPSTWEWLGSIPEPTFPDTMPTPPDDHGSAVMYEPGKIMRCGGSERLREAVATTWVVDLNNDGAGWLNASPMNKKRRNHNLVVLPDGKVLAVGGNKLDPGGGRWLPVPRVGGGDLRPGVRDVDAPAALGSGRAAHVPLHGDAPARRAGGLRGRQ